MLKLELIRSYANFMMSYGALRTQKWDLTNIALSSRIELNQEKEKVNKEEYDSKDSQSSSECCTPHQTSKTQDKHPVCSPCTGGKLKKTRVQKGKVRGFKKTT